MLPRFSKARQRSGSMDTVLLNMNWGTLEFGITISRKPLVNDFEDTLYFHQRIRNLVALGLMLLVHVLVVYWLLHKEELPLAPQEHREQIIFLDLPSEKSGAVKASEPSKTSRIQPKQTKQSSRRQSPRSIANLTQPTQRTQIPPKQESIISQIAAARERRNLLEEDAAQQNQQAKQAESAVSENDLAMARIKANIKAAQYNRKGTSGIFQVLDKGVRTGKFSFRGWTNDARQSTWQTFEVDAGVDGNVELALVRRMIELIRSHYSGDFNWESQRLGRVVVLSARPKDNARLEQFLMQEFFGGK